jgi:hypothetical protein
MFDITGFKGVMPVSTLRFIRVCRLVSVRRCEMRGIFSIITLVGLVLACLSPSISAGPVTVGAKAGLSLANLYGGDIEDNEFKLGLCAGGFVSYSFNRIFALQPELLYVEKGTKLMEQGEGTQEPVTIKLDYLEIPLLMKFSMATTGSVKPSLFLGPALAINLSSKINVNGSEADIENTFDDLGLTAGCGVAFPVGKGQLVTDARFNLGLVPIVESEDYASVEKNMAILLMVGYSLHL